MKKVVRWLLKSVGLQVSRVRNIPAAGSDARPVGHMDLFLEDVRSRGLDCRIILDVGAHKAGWSTMASKRFPEAQFVLIEPQHEMQEHLELFCSKHPGSKYFLNGAGAKNDKAVLTIWEDLAGSSFRPVTDETLMGSGKQRTVEVVTIDDLVTQGKIEIPQLIKIDVQGFELEVLEGAECTFGVTEVYIIETSLFSFSDVPGMPVIADVIKFMLDRGYVVYDFAGFLRRPLDGALGQCDVCFVKKDGFLRRSNDWT